MTRPIFSSLSRPRPNPNPNPSPSACTTTSSSNRPLRDETIIFDSPAFNDFAIAAHVWFVLLPYFRVTPYVRGGLGPEFFSSRLGVYGLWRGGTGLIIRLGKAQRFALRLGADAVGRIPDQRFSRNFYCGLLDSPCSFTIRPEIGLLFNFG